MSSDACFATQPPGVSNYFISTTQHKLPHRVVIGRTSRSENTIVRYQWAISWPGSAGGVAEKEVERKKPRGLRLSLFSLLSFI